MASASKAVKFVESDPSGLPLKRKQVQQACESCRKRKKRCVHTEDAAPDEDAEVLRSPGSGSSQSHPRLSAGVDGSGSPSKPKDGPNAKPAHFRRFVCDTNIEGMFAEATGQDAPSHYQAARFVGDTNPEGLFSEATEAGGLNGGASAARRPARNDEVGVWVSTEPGDGASSSGQTGAASATTALRASIPYDHVLLPYVREHCLRCVPPEKEWRSLRKVYYRKIHPIYMLVPESVLEDDDSPSNIVLRQVISLAAATDPSMAHNLKLSNQGTSRLPFSDFSRILSGAIRTTLATSLIADRVLHIRALSMLSVYFQPSGLAESEVPAQFYAEAVHHCQTLGLHLLRTGEPSLETLFLAVWALDKINSATYGRPRLLQNFDFAGDLDDCFGHQEPAFRLFLSISRWLDQAIDLYRPAASANALGDFKPFIDAPVLEAMIVSANALEVPTPLLATLEVYYHAVVILSCRLPRPNAESLGDQHNRNRHVVNYPPAMANARRSLASERIVTSVKREKLSPVPIVPYAVSLSLSVEYRKMRHSSLPMFRSRARDAFKFNCELLKRYKDTYFSARVTHGLGERMLKEMERVATTAVRGDTTVARGDEGKREGRAGRPEQQPGNPGPAQGGLGQQRTGQSHGHGHGHGLGRGRGREPGHRGQASSGTPSLSSGPSGQNTPELTRQDRPNAKEHDGVGGSADGMNEFTNLDAMDVDFDVFGHFDPSFDLITAENALEGNLDIGLPLNWGEWEQFGNGA